MDGAHGEWRHVAFAYDSTQAAADHLAEEITLDRRNETAVLVCLPDPLVDQLVQRIDPSEVHFIPAAERYSRPIDAVQALWRFTGQALRAGAPRVHSIGELAFDGTEADRDWHWYERAVNEVFANLPLTATCLLDLGRLSAHTLACAHSTHMSVEGAVPPPVSIDPASFTPRPIMLPQRPADLVLVGVTAPALARHELDRLPCRPDVLERARLIVSEIVTNAIVHGPGRADVCCWALDGGMIVEVSDDGVGIDDPIAGLRPPALPTRGAGLWTAQMEATRLHVGARSPHGTVITALVD